jgi:small-conductance mechanosensitive channel/CRP-like cAMP-binding protein
MKFAPMAALDFASIEAWIRDSFGWFDLVALIAAVGTFLLAVALIRPPRWARIGFTCVMLAIVPFLWLARLAFPEGSPTWWALHLPAAFLLLVVTGRSLLLVFTAGIFERWGRKLPRIAMDLLNLGIAVAALLLTLHLAGVHPGTLFAGSAVLTAVLGLALKDTLGNLFSGLALQAQRPFEVGDWIQYDDKQEHIGRVIEINWRATKVVTLDEAEVIVPNGILTEACIRNFTKPDPVARRSVMVSASYLAAPNEVHRVIMSALDACPGVLGSPKPSVVTQGFGDSGVNYWVRFFIDQFGSRDTIDGNVRDRIWYAFQRAGIAIPFPIRDVRMTERAPEARRTADEDVARRQELLGSIDLFAVLPPDSLAQLAAVAKEETFGDRELMIRQGDLCDRFFLLVGGNAIAYVKSGEKLLGIDIGRLTKGKIFGEMSLFTGAPRAASVMADGECHVLSLDKPAIAPILEANPHLVEKIGEVLADRKAALESKLDAAATHTPIVEKRRKLVQMIRTFFASGTIE